MRVRIVAIENGQVMVTTPDGPARWLSVGDEIEWLLRLEDHEAISAATRELSIGVPEFPHRPPPGAS